MAARRRKLVLLSLTAEEFAVLQQRSLENEREPEQHARWLLRRELRLLDEGTGDRGQGTGETAAEVA